MDDNELQGSFIPKICLNSFNQPLTGGELRLGGAAGCRCIETTKSSRLHCNIRDEMYIKTDTSTLPAYQKTSYLLHQITSHHITSHFIAYLFHIGVKIGNAFPFYKSSFSFS